MIRPSIDLSVSATFTGLPAIKIMLLKLYSAVLNPSKIISTLSIDSLATNFKRDFNFFLTINVPKM